MHVFLPVAPRPTILIAPLSPTWPAWLIWAFGLIGALFVAFVVGLIYLRRQDQERSRALLRQVTEYRRASGDTQRIRRQQEMLLDAARQLTASLDVKDVLSHIVAAARHILNTYGAAIYLLEEDGKTLTPVVSMDTPYDEHILAEPLDIDSSFTGQAIKARRGMIFNDAWADESGHFIRGTPEEREERVMVAPLIVNGEALGAVTLNRIGTLFTEEDLALAETFATYAGTALKNAQTHQALQREVEERRRAEAALRTSEEKFSIAFRASPGAISITSLEDGRHIDVNDSFLEMTGYGREDVIGHTVEELNLWAGHEPYTDLLDKIRETGALHNYEYTFRRKAGGLGEGLLSAEKIDLAGESCMLGVVNDITERNRLQAQLLQSQKLEAVGRLAGGVAHDFNNLLTAIIGNAELFLMGADSEKEGYGEVKIIRRTAGRAAELTKQLLALSRRQVTAPALLNLNNVIKGMSEMLPRLVGEDVQYDLVLDPALQLVKADLSQMEQVVLNLVVNAREAMPDGGALKIATENVILDEGQVYSEVEPGEYVCLSVADSGVGMPPAVQEHIWEPFFTTKSTGTGLGLATVYGVVKQFGGYIATQSEEGQGTVFEIYLPAVESEEQPATVIPEEERDDMPAGDDTILLVEDEFDIRELAHSVLTELGYTVVAARSAEDALQRMESQPMEIDLVLSDVVLPGMNGSEMVEELRRRRHRFKVLFTSGYTDDRLTGADISGEDAGFLSKPFTPLALAQKVRAVLDGNNHIENAVEGEC